MSIRYMPYESPIGTLHIFSLDEYIIRLDFAQSEERQQWFDKYFTNVAVEQGSCYVLKHMQRELDEYFAGHRKMFAVPYRLHGTDYRRGIWTLLEKIPYGQTITYGELARRSGHEKASRAVGGANHHNPISIVVPCHRVVGVNKSLTGYGGGLEKKEYLLKLEGSL